MSTPTQVYQLIMLEVERRRLELGLPQEKLSEWLGIAERSYPKYLHADTPSGRQAQWPTLQIIMDGLFPHGFRITIEAEGGDVIRPKDMKARLLGLRQQYPPVGAPTRNMKLENPTSSAASQAA